MNPSALHHYKATLLQRSAEQRTAAAAAVGGVRPPRPNSAQPRRCTSSASSSSFRGGGGSTSWAPKSPMTSLPLTTTDDLIEAESTLVRPPTTRREETLIHAVRNDHLGGVKFLHQKDVVQAIPHPHPRGGKKAYRRPQSASTTRRTGNSAGEGEAALKSSYQTYFVPHTPNGENGEKKGRGTGSVRLMQRGTRHRPAAMAAGKTTLGAPLKVEDVDRYITSNDVAYRTGMGVSITTQTRRQQIVDQEAIPLAPTSCYPHPARMHLPQEYGFDVGGPGCQAGSGATTPTAWLGSGQRTIGSSNDRMTPTESSTGRQRQGGTEAQGVVGFTYAKGMKPQAVVEVDVPAGTSKNRSVPRCRVASAILNQHLYTNVSGDRSPSPAGASRSLSRPPAAGGVTPGTSGGGGGGGGGPNHPQSTSATRHRHRAHQYPTGMGNPSIHAQLAQRRRGKH